MRLLSLLAILTCSFAARADELTLRLRYPDIHGGTIVFVYAGDLWSVPAGGGDARRLTSFEGYELFPRFSPDGTTIAFTAGYEGNDDVYTMPSAGGGARRLTWHPFADRVTGWTPDGRIVFRSKRSSAFLSFDRLFTVSAEGGVAGELPLPAGGSSSFSPDLSKIAYNPTSTETYYWKRYRGGMQSHIAVYDFKTRAYEEIPHGEAAELFPMWFRDAIFFVSDRDGMMNLYRYDVASRAVRQLTRYTGYDIKWPSLAADGSGRIVYENGGALYVYDIARETSTRVPVRVRTDAPVAHRATINVQKWLQTIALSPSGARALLGARGEVFTVPASQGEIRNITGTSGARELWPVWSPDGKWIAYASDRSGEYELYVRAQDGSGEERRLTSLGPGFRSNLTWSPNSKKIAWNELAFALQVLDLDSGKVTTVARSERDAIAGFSWSPDSQWIAYSNVRTTGFGQLFAWSLAEGKSHPITDGLTDDSQPSFDSSGNYLFFLSRRTFTPRFSDFEKNFAFNDTMRVYVVTLRSDLPSPFAPKSDEEDAAESTKTASTPFRIDFANIARRVLPLPVDAGDYTKLAATDGRAFYLARNTLKSFDLAAGEEKTLLEKIDDYALSARGGHLIYRGGKTVGILDANGGGKLGDGALQLASLEMQLDRRAEWKQIFDEAWRMMRDNFFDPTMRGVDWPAMKRRYEAELPYVLTRSDLNTLIGEMNGELGISHISAAGGDVADRPRTAAGLLGADYDVADGFYRIRKIYRGDNSAEETRSPLDTPGVDVREGDYILAVNGRPLRAPASVYAAFDQTAERQVTLLVNDRPSEAGARRNVVVPVANESELRYRDWVETNRKKVDAGTRGLCAYVHLPDTSTRGISEFGRQFYAQSDKACLLLDARWNGGGEIPDFFFERLARRHLDYASRRYGPDVEGQAPAILGPKVLVINEYAGSSGDSMADYFRKYALGPIVGKRTFGAYVGIGIERPLIDNGIVTTPYEAVWDVIDGKSTWILENHGVEPDIEVDNRPDLVIAGRDPQLERGIAVLNEELARHPPVKPKRPPYPAAR
jgi:tricorn protease